MLKAIFVILGCISLGLGIAGIFLPLLPTTPFLLLSATLFAHSSSRLYNWLLNHRIFGSYIRSFRDERAIARSIKILIICCIWITTLLNMLIFVPQKLWLHLLLVGISIGVSLHILNFKNK